MDAVFQDIINDLKNAKYQLWQALLTIDGILIAILIGAVSLGATNGYPQEIKILFAIALIALLISCALLVWNWLSMRDLYEKMSTVAKNVIDGKTALTEKLQKELSDPQKKKGKRIRDIENAVIALQIVVAILLVITTCFQLFGSFQMEYGSFKKERVNHQVHRKYIFK